MAKWKDHRKCWAECDKCELHETRKKIVLGKGKIPCEVLFVGEAPGRSEDTLGVPFVGPAGKLLEKMVAAAEENSRTVRKFYTNLIACIPLDMEGVKIHEPHKEHIHACADRLQEVIEIVKPKHVVTVGKLADKWMPKLTGGWDTCTTITHPAAILRADLSQRGLAVQNTIVKLTDAFLELG